MQQTNDNCVLVKFSQCVPTESQQMTQLNYFWRICGNVMCVFSQQMAVTACRENRERAWRVCYVC